MNALYVSTSNLDVKFPCNVCINLNSSQHTIHPIIYVFGMPRILNAFSKVPQKSKVSPTKR